MKHNNSDHVQLNVTPKEDETLYNGTSQFRLVTRYGDYSLLHRTITDSPVADPTPYVVAWKPSYSLSTDIAKDDAFAGFKARFQLNKHATQVNVTWEQGHYCTSLKNAINELERRSGESFPLEHKVSIKVVQEKNEHELKMLSLPPQDILNNSYQTAVYRDIAMIFDEEQIDLDDEQLAILFDSKNSINDIYNKWLSNDYTYMPMLRDTVEEYVNRKLDLIHSGEYQLNKKSDGVKINGHVGTWYVVDTKEYDGKPLFLLEHEDFGDEAPCIIVDQYRNIKLEDVYNGFEDYDDHLSLNVTSVSKSYELEM